MLYAWESNILPTCAKILGTSSTSAPPSGSCPTTKLDCYSDPGSNEQGCYDRGCLWCPAEGTNDPWCVFPEGGNFARTALPHLILSFWHHYCLQLLRRPLVEDAQQRSRNLNELTVGRVVAQRKPVVRYNNSHCLVIIALYLSFMKQAVRWRHNGFQSAGCIWCESSQNDVPWCFFNTTNLPEGIDDAERVNCIPEGGFSPTTCQERGCAFANVNSPDAPMCYYSVSLKQTGQKPEIDVAQLIKSRFRQVKLKCKLINWPILSGVQHFFRFCLLTFFERLLLNFSGRPV